MHGTWLGIAAVPIDTYGPLELELEFRFGDGSVYEQTVHLDAAARQWDETSLSVAPKYSSPPPEVQDRIARDRREIRAVLNTASPEWLIDGPFEAPRPYDVTAEYGQKRVFNGEMQSRHTGLDLRGQVGAPVLAAGRGRVALAGDFYFSGNGIFLDHGLGVHTGYFHLSEILVSEGDMVEKGDLIGRAGATGRVTGPHLHWSLWVDGTGQDAGNARPPGAEKNDRLTAPARIGEAHTVSARNTSDGHPSIVRMVVTPHPLREFPATSRLPENLPATRTGNSLLAPIELIREGSGGRDHPGRGREQAPGQGGHRRDHRRLGRRPERGPGGPMPGGEPEPAPVDREGVGGRGRRIGTPRSCPATA
jgi:murein DD-endopeptidase MepM/ murein hydrolase activator NlpD